MSRPPEDRPESAPRPASSGLVVGGLGGPEDELLESGQEEVFSRAEVESGQIEHHVEAGGSHDDHGRDPRGEDVEAAPPRDRPG